MLPCATCTYRVNIPGSHHYACDFNWAKWTAALVERVQPGTTMTEKLAVLKDAKAHPGAHIVSPRVAQWYAFPYNFDPLWGPDTCPGHATTDDPEKRAPHTPMGEILRILGPRLL